MLHKMFPCKLKQFSISSWLGFRRSEEGTVTVEAAIWLPFWVFFTFGIAEIALLFYGQARTLSISQDAVRSYSVGEIATGGEVTDLIIASMSQVSTDVEVQFGIVDGTATAIVTVPAYDLAGRIGIFSALSNFNVTVVAQQAREF